ncbi:MAG TPA: PmoA family protein [Candidatus Paceibacterota bacterium]|nr:PmoA family protein [Candidatus Paceibacterota bacterium]
MMKHSLLHGTFGLLLIGAWTAPGSTRLAAADMPWTAEPERQATRWTIAYEGRPILVYEFDPGKFKPYVRELRTLDGHNILRDAPHDHLHHHALMYGIKVNGLNFWEETSGAGVQLPVHTAPPEFGRDAQGRPQAALRQRIHWVASADAFLPLTNQPALLIEDRMLVLTVDAAASEVALLWAGDFAVGNAAPEVALSGANYHGLGIRFREDLDAGARHFHDRGPIDLAGTRQDVSRHPWAGVELESPGFSAVLTLSGSADNRRGDPVFFSMKRPFAYLSATEGLDAEPLVYRAGDRWRLAYRLALSPKKRSQESIR